MDIKKIRFLFKLPLNKSGTIILNLNKPIEELKSSLKQKWRNTLNKSLRFKRFLSKGGNKKLFQILNKKQLSDKKKAEHSDFVVVNEKNKIILKKKLLDILKKYE